jgi:GTPase
MKFVDQVRIHVRGGDGGNGAIAFRREKYVDKGGPSGGDGGNGGSVIFVAEAQLTTLLDFRYLQQHFARNGQHGLGSDCNGRNADDMILKVPVGTLVVDEATGETLKDFSVDQERWVVAKGGRGGLGNINFATATRQAPRFAQDGTLGQEKRLVLELKLLADVGLIGFPNAGKSTIISRISKAKPKIADYPFTTLTPNLGVVGYKDKLSFVVADIPGLIEGAADGQGLGHQFLRHVERCRALVHVVDLSAEPEGRTALRDFNTINAELKQYDSALAKKPQVVVANKLDLPDAQTAFPAFEKAMKRRNIDVIKISSATGLGLDAMLDACAKILFSTERTAPPRLKARHTPKRDAILRGKTVALEERTKAPKRRGAALTERLIAPSPLAKSKPTGAAKMSKRKPLSTHRPKNPRRVK